MRSDGLAFIHILQRIFLLQLFISSLCPTDRHIWDQSSPIGKIVGILAMVSFISPAQVDHATHTYLVTIGICIVTISNIVFYMSMAVYTKFRRVYFTAMQIIMITLMALSPAL
jgi:hypothetical protein